MLSVSAYRSPSGKAGLARRCLCAAVAAALCAGTAHAGDYERAIEQARRGEYKSALEILERLHAADPADVRYTHDEIAVLSWAGEHERALALMGQIPASLAPYYVLEAAGTSARRLGRLAQAEEFLREAVRRFPDEMQGRLLLAETLVDLGRGAEADALMQAGAPSIERSLAQASFAEYRSDFLGALARYGEVANARPDDQRALAGEIRAAAHLGAVHVASDIARDHPGVISKEELDGLLADRAGLDIRWAIAREKLNPHADRFDDLDAAIRESDAAAVHFKSAPADISPAERRLLFDRVVALSARYRMNEAVQLFHDLSAQPGAAVPGYVKAAAGHAYLYLRQPEEAAELFRTAIAEGDTTFRTEMGLFYALEDADRDPEAIEHIDHLAASEPKQLGGEQDPAVRENSDYVSTRTAAALARSWDNRQDDAEQRLQVLTDEAPNNSEVRSALAGVMRARGWPRQASGEYAEILANDPDDAGAHAERSQVSLDFDDFRTAEAEMKAALAQRPEDSEVQRAKRMWSIQNMMELDTDATMGRSSGNSPSGSRDYQIDSTLYAAPIDYNWRPFVHAFWAEGQFPSGTARNERAAGGLEYRDRGLVVSGEVSGGCCGTGKPGGALSTQWWANDYWHMDASAELQTNQLPLQARLAGYDADRISAGTGYRFSESRAVKLNASVMHISDGNIRDSVYATWDERLFASARLKLDFEAGVYASTNSRHDAPYFNPRSDFSPSGTLSLEWLTWHRYDRSFTQKLSGSLGTYDEAGFGAIRTSEILYEHIWDIDNVFTLRYGAGRVLHAYDGSQTGRNFLNLALVARFW
jgi:biofilm PGA synthesis protein PgaA